MDRGEYLTEQAERARRLSEIVGDERTKGDLLAYADGCDREREALSASAQQPYATHMTDSPLTPEALATWTDEAVADAWKGNSWEIGDPRADALAAEMERRNLDF